MGVDVEELRSPLRGRRLVGARELLAVVGAERYGLRVVDIARGLRKSPDTVTKAIPRATRRCMGNPSLRREVERLDKAITESAMRDAANNGGTA